MFLDGLISGKEEVYRFLKPDYERSLIEVLACISNSF